MRQWHRGNAFSQAQHDGGSRHGIKYQVLGMQGVPPGLDKNLVLCIGCDVLLDSKGDTVALGLDDASFNVLGLKCSQLVNAVVSDRAALSVGKNRDVFPLYQVIDVAPCLMHDMDKPQASALGKLVRSSNISVTVTACTFCTNSVQL